QFTTGSSLTIAIDPVQSNNVYIAMAQGGIAKSTDSGQTWNSLNDGFQAANITGFDLKAGGMFASTQDGPYYSGDGGKHWALAGGKPSDPNINSIVSDPNNLSTVYAGTNNGVSKHGFISWFDINTGLTNKQVTKLVMDPTNSSTLYAGTYSGGVF